MTALATPEVPATRPVSDVSPIVGVLGVISLLGWFAFCRHWPEISSAFDLPGPRERMDGPFAVLTGLVVACLPMVAWSLVVDKVHRRPSTGIDWSLARTRKPDLARCVTKIAGLWTTWAIIAGLYCVSRWYWSGSYEFAMSVLAVSIIPLALLSIPYVVWLDRVLVEPRDHAWHFGALLSGRGEWELEEVKKHGRAWLIKGFFAAFMISILPGGFVSIVNTDLSGILDDPVRLGVALLQLMFVIDVQIGTIGYIVTMRPLDAHIRSGNPFLAGWLAALICYPPFVWGIIGNGLVLNYESNTRDWAYWFAGSEVLLWVWAAWLVFLTAIYAWATFAFGLRFSNLTYRGVITHGPYRFTRHPAYVSKNLFWWCSVMPFLVTTGSPVDAIRNVFCLLCVNAIYYWRARTEEAHLLGEDQKYREYHAWMGAHGLITAPLTRLTRAIIALRPAARPQPAE
ncbi:protein-S-isoprenylcysteine methyltransferase [Erythrobacter sp. QSSC1-22B]|uniref:methyltransferase family protein n=1 Tax=Erythrobacter sp. QSSC1-22B TaxID=1860125 RepID=UPI00080568C9|nr:methyltransferase [Erythrobacter sp. QSSC1-22B]OBX18534.1 protein-S-isoprenylcysteine methyltransferase [Erythrobacter sp. QSSC1-22B]